MSRSNKLCEIKYSVELLVEVGRIHDGQTVTQALNLPQDVIVLGDARGLDIAHVLGHDLDAIVQERDGGVLSAEMLGHGRLHERPGAAHTRRVDRVLGDVIDADSFGLVRRQRVLELDEEYVRSLVDEVNHRLVDRHGQVGVLAERIEFEQEWTLVYRAHLFVQRGVAFVRAAATHAPRRVPAEEVKVGEYLLDFFVNQHDHV